MLTLPPWLGRAEPELVRDYLDPAEEPRTRNFAAALERCVGAGRTIEVHDTHNSVSAIAGVEKLAWDSEHFGIGCARLAPVCVSPGLFAEQRLAAVAQIVDAAMAWCREHELSVLQRRVVGARGDEVRILEDRGFRLMDSIVTFTAQAKVAGEITSVRSVRTEDHTALLDIARDAFPHSRFLADPVFDPAKARAVYVRWLQTLLSGHASGDKSGAGGDVLVAEDAGKAVGFLSIRRDQNLEALTGRIVMPIEMIAVAGDKRGQGIGGRLLDAACSWAAQHGAELVEASTWTASMDIRKFYQRAGFVMRDVLFTLHGRVS